MKGYLGEENIDWKITPEFGNYTEKDWTLYFIALYGGIDGSHHKDWVLDQVARILHGAEITMKVARWENGSFEYRVNKIPESEAYLNWIEEITEGGEYGYDCGIAP